MLPAPGSPRRSVTSPPRTTSAPAGPVRISTRRNPPFASSLTSHASPALSAVAAQRAGHRSADVARRRRRGARIRSISKVEHHQAAYSFVVPPRQHALRPHPHHARGAAAALDRAVRRNAGRVTDLCLDFRGHMKMRGVVSQPPTIPPVDFYWRRELDAIVADPAPDAHCAHAANPGACLLCVEQHVVIVHNKLPPLGAWRTSRLAWGCWPHRAGPVAVLR